MQFFSHLTTIEAIWRAPWMPTSPLTYRCGKLAFIPLLGLWGGIAYSPLLVLRQSWSKQFAPVVCGLEDWEFSYESNIANDKIHEAVEAWKFVKKMKSLRHCEGTTEQYDNWRASRNGITMNPMSESLVPNIELKKYHDKEKELKRLREMNCVLATENEKLREEVKKWVQQAVNTQRDLDEAKRKRLELEKENDSLNTEAIQVRKKNKRLLRNIANLHEEIEAKKVCITDLKHEIERLNGVALEFIMHYMNKPCHFNRPLWELRFCNI